MTKSNTLSYWDEISSYLQVSNKTAQRYCKSGMPVKRDAAGHPYITKKAIDKWLFNKKQKSIQ